MHQRRHHPPQIATFEIRIPSRSKPRTGSLEQPLALGCVIWREIGGGGGADDGATNPTGQNWLGIELHKGMLHTLPGEPTGHRAGYDAGAEGGRSAQIESGDPAVDALSKWT